eukprot:3234697-Amphidinium_carterae.1
MNQEPDWKAPLGSKLHAFLKEAGAEPGQVMGLSLWGDGVPYKKEGSLFQVMPSMHLIPSVEFKCWGFSILCVALHPSPTNNKPEIAGVLGLPLRFWQEIFGCSNPYRTGVRGHLQSLMGIALVEPEMLLAWQAPNREVLS